MKRYYIVLILITVLIFGCSAEEKKDSIRAEVKKTEKKIKANLEKAKKVHIKMKIDLDRVYTIINEITDKVKVNEEIANKIRERLEEVKVNKKIAIVLGDLKSVGIAIEAYSHEVSEVPKVKSFIELKEVKKFVDGYIKKLPLKDPWGHYYFYKYDKNNPKKYWIGSAGKDGKFDGFEKKKKKPEKNDDIILTGDVITLGPAIF